MNVCALRMPNNTSLLTRSHCAHCNEPIKFYDNIPIFSYLFLRGIARCCKKPISIQYPIVELLSLIIIFMIFSKFGYEYKSILLYFLFLSLIIIFISDLKFFIVPDLISLSLIILGIISVLFNLNPFNITMMDSLIAGFSSGILFYIISQAFYYLKDKEGLGFGDIKLISAIGFWSGVESTLLIILTSSLIGIFTGLILINFNKINKNDYLPYGCFIVCSSMIIFYLNSWHKFNFFTLFQI